MLQELELKLEYKFKDIKILAKALTHSSFSNVSLNSNERLEFLGDKVLGNIVAFILYESYPKKDEGFLSRFFSYLTSEEVLVLVGKKLEISNYIKHNTSLEDSVIADSIEAIIASIYIDCGDINTVKKFIKNYWDVYIQSYNEESIYKNFNPKSTLQDWAQKHKLKIPEYIDVAKEGDDHNPIFLVKVEVEGYKAEEGRGKNKKNAQKEAAQKFIEIHKIN
ncbi:MAG: ribonuclease III [Alphaproteobacteria bacterium]|jgi:ribonuclease-3|nr:ribonuclease III [Alphaproteobacteria bacterium]